MGILTNETWEAIECYFRYRADCVPEWEFYSTIVLVSVISFIIGRITKRATSI